RRGVAAVRGRWFQRTSRPGRMVRPGHSNFAKAACGLPGCGCCAGIGLSYGGSPLMQEKGLRPLASAVIIALLAAVLRFYDLGAWPYSGDETASLHEEEVLFHGAQVSHDSQAYRLPRLIPTSYLALHISHALFGRDEWGTRVVVALLGVLSVVLVFWLLVIVSVSRTVATVAAVLVALLPQHVLHSQETRF